MAKLASARESRMYGPWRERNGAEYLNAGLYALATIVLVSGFAALLYDVPEMGLVLLIIALFLMIAVDVHDLVAHLAGVDNRLNLMELDTQLALVEFAVPVTLAMGTLLSFLGILFIVIQEEKGYGYHKWETHALNMVLAGAALWLVGSIHNSCQIYERAEGQIQVWQHSVHIPFLMGSMLFLVGAILNSQQQSGSAHHGIELLGWTWGWFGVVGSLLFLVGGVNNAVKVFKMQQHNGRGLEKLRGGAQERLNREREGQVPLILEEQGRRRKDQIVQGRERHVPINIPEDQRSRRSGEEEGNKGTVSPTPYKDVLLSRA